MRNVDDAGRNRRTLLFILAMLATTAGPLSTHIFGPAMPDAARDLDVPPSVIQLSVTLYVAGFALGNLVYGQIADYFGRRPALLASFAIYAVASVASALAANAEMLLVARLLQSLGSGAGPVVGRAMIRDTSDGSDSTRQLAYVGIVMSASPLLGPAIGGYVAALAGWRAIFWLLAVLSSALFVVMLLLQPETRPRDARPVAGRGLFSGIPLLLRQRLFRAYAFGGALSAGSTYVFLAAVPFLFDDLLGIPPERIGVYFLLGIAGYTVGSMLTARLAGRVPLRAIAVAGALCSLGSALMLVGVGITGRFSVPLVIGPMMLQCLGNALVLPSAMSGAMDVDNRAIGAASGVFLFLMQMTGALTALAISQLYDRTIWPSAIILLLTASTALYLLAVGTRTAGRR